MAFIIIENGKIAIERTTNINAPDKYSVPKIESINFGDDISAAISGAVKLIPILVVTVDKSTFDTDDDGSIINAILEAKVPTIKLIIRAM
jgi:hypothetical protein